MEVREESVNLQLVYLPALPRFQNPAVLHRRKSLRQLAVEDVPTGGLSRRFDRRGRNSPGRETKFSLDRRSFHGTDVCRAGNRLA